MPLGDHFFIDSARYYPYSKKTEKFTAEIHTNDDPNRGPQSIGLFGRDGRYGHRIYTANLSGPPIDSRFIKTISPRNQWGITSFAFRRDATQNNGVGPNSIVIAQFWNINACLASLVLNQDSTFSVLQGNQNVGGGTTLVSSGRALPLDEYGHIEWRNKFATGTGGQTTVWLNGEKIIDKTGISLLSSDWTAGSWGVSMGGFQFSAATTVANHDYCDIILRDGSVRVMQEGTLLAGTDPWGDTRVLCLLSQTGNGAHTDWTPLTGSNHGAMVSEAQEDGDASYVTSNTADQRDSYEMEDLPADVGDVLGIQLVEASRKELAGTAFVKGFIRISGVDYDGDKANGLGTTYVHCLSPMVSHSGAPFTIAEINACQTGPLLLHVTSADITDPPDPGSTGGGGDPPPEDGGGGGGCTGVPTTAIPSWLRTALIAAGATNCYVGGVLEAVEGTLNANDYSIQRNSGCQNRGRIILGPSNHALWRTWCGHLDAGLVEISHKDLVSSSGEWQWV